MYISEKSLDDLMRSVYEKVILRGKDVKATRGSNKELFGVLLELRNPRNRLSRTYSKGTLFSCIGEFLWYFTKDNKLDFVEYYIPGYSENSDDGKTVYGGYGPRFFRMRGRNNQIENIVNLLKLKSNTRKAVVQLFDSEDLYGNYKDIPCTCALQFMIREKKLNLMVNMRSNDVYKGLPHDIFCFTMIQEVIARSVGIEIGTYKHSVGSLHMYHCDYDKVEKYLDEGFQPTNKDMPVMPIGASVDDIFELLKFEKMIRSGFLIDVDKVDMSDYWKDILRVVQLYVITKDKVVKDGDFERIVSSMYSNVYAVYLNKRVDKYWGNELMQQEIEFNGA